MHALSTTHRFQVRPNRSTCFSTALLLLLLFFQGNAGVESQPTPSPYAAVASDHPVRVIIGQNTARLRTSVELEHLLTQSTGFTAHWHRAASGTANVYEFPATTDRALLSRKLAKLERAGSIEYSQYDAPVTVQAIPDDQLFAMQWPYHNTVNSLVGINLPDAWEISTGSPETVIAVVDTGVRYDHSDLTNRLLAGFDFVSGINEAADTRLPVDTDFNFARSNDQDGRDGDATDPGDGVTEGFKGVASDAGLDCASTDSTWHGTAMSSLIAANVNDGIGMAGIDWHAQILPVRAVGRCGGSRSDLLDAIRWAAGVEDPALPPNPNPARIINLSLGIDDVCGAADQRAINDAIAAGAIVVAAVGNQGRNLNTAPAAPSDCRNVIGVGAVNTFGNRANYSNYGLDVDISAPGGENRSGDGREILVASNDGVIDPIPGSSHRQTSGTSVASPMVSGVLSLMLGANPALSNEELEFLLYESARAFSFTSSANNCNQFTCGAGMLDAYAAVVAAEQSLYTPVEISESFRTREQNVTSGGGAGTVLGCSISPVTASITADQNRTSFDPSFLLLLISLLYCRRQSSSRKSDVA